MLTPEPSLLTYFAEQRDSSTISFGSNSMQHGTAVFEGIRCYSTVGGASIFRLRDHMNRLLRSAASLGLVHGYTVEALEEHVVEAAQRSGLADSYLRPVLFTNEPALGVNMRALRFELAVEVWAMPAVEPVAPDLALTVSPWARPSMRSIPRGTKATGTYVTSALARTEAGERGFDDAIQLDPDSSRVAEATVTNVFLVRDNTVLTPWLEESVLPGITRDTVLAVADELGVESAEGPVEVADLSRADEIFLTGTASGLMPVTAFESRALDPRRPVFSSLSEAYADVVSGRTLAGRQWCTELKFTG